MWCESTSMVWACRRTTSLSISSTRRGTREFRNQGNENPSIYPRSSKQRLQKDYGHIIWRHTALFVEALEFPGNEQTLRNDEKMGWIPTHSFACIP